MLEKIIESLRLPVLRNLPKCGISKRFILSSLKEFHKYYEGLQGRIKVPNDNWEFYNSLILLWKRYWRDVYLMDAIYPRIFPLYPEKRKILYEFLRYHYVLNVTVYHFTTQEKRFARNVNRELLNSVFTPYSFFKELLDIPRELILVNPRGRILYQLLFYNDVLVEKFLEKLKDKAYDRKIPIIEEKDSIEFRILLFDHFIELIWRESEALSLDAKFIYPLARFFNKASMLETINHLGKETKEFKYTIPFYRQHFDSCGVVCLLNIFGTFGIIKPDKKLERKFLEEITVEGYYGNLTPFIVKLAEKYGLRAYMFIDYKDYLEKVNRIVSSNPELKKPAEAFLNGMRKIKWIDKSGFTFDEIVELVKTGHLISYVGMSGKVRHYRLIFGYNLERRVLYVYDPLGFTFELGEKKIQKEMRNDISFWGFIVEAPDRKILDVIKEETKEVRNIINRFLS